MTPARAPVSSQQVPLPDKTETSEHEAKARSQQYGVRDAACQAAAQGGGETYFSAFALLLQASPFHIAILSALPQLVGVLAQLASVKVLQYLRLPGRLLIAGGWAQASCWLPILLLPLIAPEHGPWLLIGCAMLYFGFGHVTAPVWHSLLVDVAEADSRGAYFARRARTTALTSFLALGLAGAILTLGQRWNMSWIGFLVIFLGAAAARMGATTCQTHVSRLMPAHRLDAPHGFRHVLAHAGSGNFRRFLTFSGLMHFAVMLSGPFFVIYLLRDLHWSYLQYAGWMASSISAQFLTLGPWGRIGDRYGNKALLALTASAVPFLPMGYLLSEHYAFLLIVNFFGGVIWAGLSLGLQNYVFDSLQPEERTRGVALANAMNAVGWGLGALTGSWVATLMPATVSLGSWHLTPASNLPFLFCLSGGLRLVIALSLLRTFAEPRCIASPPEGHLVWEMPLLKPLIALLPWRNPRVAP
ncbi:MAG: putative Transporter of MFS family, contains Lipocalin domain [Nitrospira sp.]|jgi:MFS family permease